MVDPGHRNRPCRSFHNAASSAIRDMPGSARDAMSPRAADPDRKTACRVRPARARMTTATRRLPVWCLGRRQRTRFSLWFAGLV
jgi:hypothetical protein